MTSLAWPLVALILGGLAFSWCWRWADTRARMTALMDEREVRFKRIITEHVAEMAAHEARQEKLETRLHALELYRGEHERIHASY